jgi:hypothetical protein
MRHFLRDILFPCLILVASFTVLFFVLRPAKEDYCRWTARDESALTACQADANCRSTPKDWERFQRNSRECLAR